MSNRKFFYDPLYHNLLNVPNEIKMNCYNGYHSFLDDQTAKNHGIDFAHCQTLLWKKSTYEESLTKKFGEVNPNVRPDSHEEIFLRMVHDKKDYFFTEHSFGELCDELAEKTVHALRADSKAKKFQILELLTTPYTDIQLNMLNLYFPLIFKGKINQKKI